METMVSINDHERSVSFIPRLKYSLNNQNPASFTCENIKLPAPMDNTIRLGSVLVYFITGAMMPAVVRPATVADPTHTLMMAAMSHPNTSGCREDVCNIAAMLLLTPLSINTCFRAPAPATISRISDTSLIASPYQPMIC